MSAQCMILPTREALSEHAWLLRQATEAGMSWLLVANHVLDAVVQGHALKPLTPRELHEGLLDMVYATSLLNPRALELVRTDEFARMLYALYWTVFHLQDTLLAGAGKGNIISSITWLSWSGSWDLTALVETTQMYAPQATYSGIRL